MNYGIQDDQENIRQTNQKEFNENVIKFNENVVKRLEELEDFKGQALIRLDQEIENRTKAFERIEELENKFNLLEEYTIKGINRDIRDFEYKTSISQERHDDIIAVHRNEIDNLKKDRTAMQQILNNYLMVNLDNPEYITKIHEKRGNHGTSNTKGEKPK
ncbi:MAG TPA: hypothetical protein EYO93_00635 [Nitrososphaerales archaeon]|nr:hypothetical protein [Nitrososphaerales archaeon]